MGAGASLTSNAASAAEGGVDGKILEIVEAFRSLAPEQKQQLVRLVDQASGDRNGTSTLEIDQGLFRLIQGASYRVYKPKYALNYHTHLQDRSLPYLWSNFVLFIRATADLVKALALGKLNLKAWEELVECVEEEDKKLKVRIQEFDVDSVTAEQRKAHENMLAERSRRKEVREDFSDLTHAAYASKHDVSDLAEVVERVAQSAGVVEVSDEKKSQCTEKFHKEKQAVGYLEGFDTDKSLTSEAPSSLFIDQWNQVLIESSNEEIDGAMVCNRFWYESFMPKLAAACTSEPDEGDHEDWFEQSKEEFKPFATDILDGFAHCTTDVKLTIRRVWRLTRHYLLGPQKRRERWTDSGADHRETGDLSQYVAFIDVFLGRAYVEHAQMRLTFPYFIGPSTWKLMHTIAEIACAHSVDQSVQVVECFKAFFRLFATLYPCPYCRHHLNRYVVLGKERSLYPVEYLLLGWASPSENPEGRLSLEDKLSDITDAKRLRLFLWKLHNSVNASIARSEEWYHSDQEAIYTSRYWPNIDGELLRAQSLGVGMASAERIDKISSILKIGTRLAACREQMLEVALQDPKTTEKVLQNVNRLIVKLDNAVVEGGFLQEVYSYDPKLTDPCPSRSWNETGLEESFVRNEDFTLA